MGHTAVAPDSSAPGEVGCATHHGKPCADPAVLHVHQACSHERRDESRVVAFEDVGVVRALRVWHAEAIQFPHTELTTESFVPFS